MPIIWWGNTTHLIHEIKHFHCTFKKKTPDTMLIVIMNFTFYVMKFFQYGPLSLLCVDRFRSCLHSSLTIIFHLFTSLWTFNHVVLTIASHWSYYNIINYTWAVYWCSDVISTVCILIVIEISETLLWLNSITSKLYNVPRGVAITDVRLVFLQRRR